MSQLETLKTEQQVELRDIEESIETEEDVFKITLRGYQELISNFQDKLAKAREYNRELIDRINDLEWYRRYVEKNVPDFEQWKVETIRKDAERALERERIYQKYGTNDANDIETIDKNMEKIRELMRSRREEHKTEEE